MPPVPSVGIHICASLTDSVGAWNFKPVFHYKNGPLIFDEQRKGARLSFLVCVKRSEVEREELDQRHGIVGL